MRPVTQLVQGSWEDVAAQAAATSSWRAVGLPPRSVSGRASAERRKGMEGRTSYERLVGGWRHKGAWRG